MRKENHPLDNLDRLHSQEESLRGQAISILQGNSKLLLHLDVIERAMTVARVVTSYQTNDEDLKVIKMLSVRLFNAFGASMKLMLSGYHQKSAMIMRDILETVFLLDLFNTDRTAIERWRKTDKRLLQKEFSARAVREALDKRDGLNTQKRAKAYKMFSELASHPTMWTQNMLKAEMDGDILTGPFMGETILRQGLEELGRLAVQAGDIMDAFLPKEWDPENIRKSFAYVRNKWIEIFYRSPTKF